MMITKSMEQRKEFLDKRKSLIKKQNMAINLLDYENSYYQKKKMTDLMDSLDQTISSIQK